MAEVLPLNKARRRAKEAATSLTAARVRALRPREREYWEADGGCRGLYVRVQPSGEKSYYLRARIGGGRGAKQRKIRIGAIDQVPLADARTQAMALAGEMRRGGDPVERERQSRTIAELVVGYGKDLDARGVVNRKSVASSLNRHLGPLLKRPAAEVTRADFIERINRCRDLTGPAAATAFRGFVAAMLNWAVNEGALTASVLAGYKAPKRTRAQRLSARDQFALKGEAQISAFWKATEAAEDPVFRDYLRFCLLTGQRRTETALMRRSDVEGDWWTIPAEVRKNGLEHDVPLGPLSLALLREQPERCELTWPGRGDVAMAGWSQRLKPIKEAMNEPRLAMHGLRRAYRTGIRELGADSDIAELMIGHTREGLIRRYDMSELRSTRMEVQISWETWIEAATSNAPSTSS